MERKKQYQDKQVQQDLYQYEMGIELGAEIEEQKKKNFESCNSCKKSHKNNNHNNNK